MLFMVLMVQVPVLGLYDVSFSMGVVVPGWVTNHFISVRPLGSRSFTWMLVAVSGPLLVAFISQIAVSPSL